MQSGHFQSRSDAVYHELWEGTFPREGCERLVGLEHPMQCKVPLKELHEAESTMPRVYQTFDD